MGCPSCDQAIIAELSEADRSSLGEEATAVLDGEINPPTNVGPLSHWDGPYCSFCHRVGQLIAIGIGVMISFIAYSSGFHYRIAAVLGIMAWFTQMIVVGMKGHYPVLGPIFGPIAERILATFRIYPTAKAKQKYGSDDDHEFSETQLAEVSDSDLPDNVNGNPGTPDLPDERVVQLKRQIGKYEGLLEQERAAKTEILTELDEVESERESLQQTKQQIEQQKEQIREEYQEVKKHHEKFWVGRSREGREQLPTLIWNGEGASVGPKYYVKTVEIKLQRDDVYGTFPFAFLVDDPSDANDLGQIPENILDGEVEQYQKYGDFYPDPETVTNPPQFEHPGQSGYPQTTPNADVDEYPRVLFHEDKGVVRKARKEKNEVTDNPQQSVLHLAYTENGDYVPPKFDPRGFENYNEERNKVQKLRRTVSTWKHRKKKKDDKIEELEHHLDLANDRVEDLQHELEQNREQVRSAHQIAHKQTQELATQKRALADTHRERMELEDDLERQRDRAHKERRRAIEGNGSAEAVLEREKAKQASNPVFWTAAQLIDGCPWEPVDYNYHDVEHGEVGVKTYVAEFLDAENAPDQLQNRIEGMLYDVLENVGDEMNVMMNGGETA